MYFTWFDIVIFAIIGISAFVGGYKGLVKTVLGIVSFIVSIFATSLFYPYIIPFLDKYISNEVALAISSATVAYISSTVILSFIFFRIRSLIHTESFIDKFLGLFLGLIRGGVISLALFSVVIVFSTGSYIGAYSLEDIIVKTNKDKYPDWLKKSTTTQPLDNAYHNIITSISKETLSSFKFSFEKNKYRTIPDFEESSEKESKSTDEESPTEDQFKMEDDFEKQ